MQNKECTRRFSEKYSGAEFGKYWALCALNGFPESSRRKNFDPVQGRQFAQTYTLKLPDLVKQGQPGKPSNGRACYIHLTLSSAVLGSDTTRAGKADHDSSQPRYLGGNS